MKPEFIKCIMPPKRTLATYHNQNFVTLFKLLNYNKEVGYIIKLNESKKVVMMTSVLSRGCAINQRQMHN